MKGGLTRLLLVEGVKAMSRGRPWEPFDLYPERYDSWYESRGKGFYEVELAAVLKVVELERLPRPYLEVGVGSGRFAVPLGIDVGVDASEAMIRIARQRGINVLKAQAETLPFPDSTFGTVFIIYTICFLDEPLKALKEAYRVLRDDGRLLVALTLEDTPLGRVYSEKIRKGEGVFYSRAKLLTSKRLLKLAGEAGFSLSSVYSTLFLDVPHEALEGGIHKDAKRFVKGLDLSASFHVFVFSKP